MLSARLIKSVINEYGVNWVINRILYSIKLKSMSILPLTEQLYEKKTEYPSRLDILDIDVEVLSRFIHNLAETDRKQLIDTADKACRGIILGFSSIDLDYGNPVDWQLNPLTGKRCDDKQKWYRISDFDNERGDIKVTWEASRFSHFITFVRAYLLTADTKYYEAFSNQLKDWLEKNPYSYGANFKCGQECSFRMVNCLLAFIVFKNVGIATDADASNVKDLIDRCYRKILSNFFYAYKCVKNNHTISELMGMIIGAWCCKNEQQLEKAHNLLNGSIAEQFTTDGGYKQFSFNYQRLALQDIEVIMSLKTGKSLNNYSIDRIRNSAWLMYQCQDENGDMPNYGNNDGALVFQVTSCGYRDFRPIINTIYALSSGRQLYDNGKHQEELIWFSGGKRIDDYPKYTFKRVSSQFVDAGLFTIRDKVSWLMVVSNEYHSRPAHMDQNHIDLWIDNVNVLCDAGSYSYASEEGRKLVNNKSHNTSVVDGKNQMNIQEPFLIFQWTERKIKMINDGTYEVIVTSKNGYTHCRRIERTEYGFEIKDTVDSDFFILYHTPCEVELNANKAKLLNDGKEICTIICEASIRKGNAKRSLFYLKDEIITCLQIAGRANQEIVTKIKIYKEETEND